MNTERNILEGEQLTRYLQRCVQLAQGNEISIRNAFDIHLIDQMIGFCRDLPKDAEKQETSFPLASMSLHASGKIYGLRVDSVEKDTFRLITEHSRQGKRPAVTEEASESQATKKRRLSTYLADEEAINGPIKIDYSLSRNSIIDKVTCNHSNAYGRLMSYNLIPPETQGIDLEGESPWWTGDHLERVALKNRLIRIRKNLPLLIKCVELNVDMPMPVDVKTEDDALVFDPTADPMPEEEGIAPVDIDSYDFEDPSSGELDDVRSDAPGDFSDVYNESFKSTGTNFAGPSKFRLKRYDISGVEKRRSRSSSRTQKNEPKYLSFKDIPAGIDEYEPDRTKWTELSPGTMAEWTEEAHVFEVDPAPSSFARLAELFAFPNRPIPEDEPDDAGPSSNFSDDSGDALCGEQTGDTHFDDETVNDSGLGEDRFQGSGDFDETDAEIEVPVSQYDEDLRYDTLISAPGTLASLITVKHAKEARKLKVNQMKESFWKVLTNGAATDTMDGEKSFAAMYSEAIPHLTVANRRNINLQIAFVATLSLCNQKHLILNPKEDSADFILSQATVPRESGETNRPIGRSRPRKMMP